MQVPTPPPTRKRKRDPEGAAPHLSPIAKARKLAHCHLSGATGPDTPPTSMASDMQRLHLQDSNEPLDVISTSVVRPFQPGVWSPNRSLGPSTSPRSSALPIKLFDEVPSEDNSLDGPETPCLRPTRIPSPPYSSLHSKTDSPAQTLWWSDTEITGHGLDPVDPEDDGEGINGIGFMPTPAIAYARAEKRRRQVKDWKEREAREARAKRGERRRRHEPMAVMTSGDEKALEDNARRVRFLKE